MIHTDGCTYERVAAAAQANRDSAVGGYTSQDMACACDRYALITDTTPTDLITVNPVGREAVDEWVGMVYEVRAPEGWNFGGAPHATHAYREFGRAVALAMRRALVRGGLERCDDDCDCTD